MKILQTTNYPSKTRLATGGKLRTNSGQSLAEIIIAMSIGGILIGSAAIAISLSMKSNYDTKIMQTAGFLSSEYVDILSSIAESNWISLFNPPAAKGPDSQFYLSPSGMSYSIAAGSTSTIIEGRTFIYYFSIENVNRDSCGIGDVVSSPTSSCAGPGTTGVAEDPSTQKITVKVSWTGGGNLTKTIYLTRNRNNVFTQFDWSGGNGQEFFTTSSDSAAINNKFSTSSGNVDFSTHKEIKLNFYGF